MALSREQVAFLVREDSDVTLPARGPTRFKLLSRLGQVREYDPVAWQGRAACAEPGIDQDSFFDLDYFTGGRQGRVALVAELKDICESCPVQRACLDYAIANNERWGFWGGFTTYQRDQIRKARKLDGSAL